MFGKMYVASVEKTREGDLVTLSPVPAPAAARSEGQSPANEMPPGERPPVYGGGTGSLGSYDDRPTSPEEHLRLSGDLRFFAPPNATAKSGQVYLLSITLSGGETIPEEAEGAKKRKQPDNHSRH
jgi:hypothetical protein